MRLKLHRRLVCLARSAKARGLWVQGLCCPFRLQKFSFLGDRARGCIPLLLWCSRCWNVRASVCRTSLAHNLKLFSFADSYKISHPLRTCCCILGSLSTLQVHCASPVPFPGKVQSDAGRGQHKEKAFVRAIQMWKLGLVLRKYPGPCP